MERGEGCKVIKNAWCGIDWVAESDKRLAVDTSVVLCFLLCLCLFLHLSAATVWVCGCVLDIIHFDLFTKLCRCKAERNSTLVCGVACG